MNGDIDLYTIAKVGFELAKKEDCDNNIKSEESLDMDTGRERLIRTRLIRSST